MSLLSINHWKTCCFKQRVTRKQLKNILLEDGDWIMRHGQRCELQKKHLGAGVYEIWFKSSP